MTTRQYWLGLGWRTRLVLSLACVVAAACVVIACRSRSGDGQTSTSSSSSSGAIGNTSFDKPALLRAFGECALADYREFSTAAVALDAAVGAAADGTPATRDAARVAWRTAMDVWQRAELFQFGPAAISTTPGGQNIRDSIYGWPLVSRCEIEQNIVAKAYEAPNWATTSLVSGRTLSAAEYLLFYEGADNGCLPDNAINTGGTWTALGAPEIAARKVAYARIVTADLVARASHLVDAWDPAKANFIGELSNAGKTTAFPTEQSAFNVVSDAMFYVDIEIKNLKVGKPSGLLPDCAAPPCLSSVESPYAKRSKEHMRANMVGYDKLLRGCGANGEGLGFDDLLRAVGAEAVAVKLDSSVASIRTALDGLVEPTFEEDLQKNPNGVKALFDALRNNANVMKTEMVTVLDLELPRRVEGDND